MLPQQNSNIFSKIFCNIFPTFQKVNLHRLKLNLEIHGKKYCNVKLPKHQKNVINNLMKRNNIVIMKRDKGRGVVVMGKSKYTQKGLTINDKSFRN